MIWDKFIEMTEIRGKRNYNKEFQIWMMKDLISRAEKSKCNNAVQIALRFSKVSTLIEFSLDRKSLTQEQWDDLLTEMESLLRLLESAKDVIVSPEISEEAENFLDLNRPLAFRNSPVNTMLSIDIEYIKIFQNTDQYSTEYAQQLRHETTIVKLLRQLCKYQEGLLKGLKGKKGERHATVTDETCKAYLLLIKHLYYKFDNNPATFEELQKMYTFIYKNDVTRMHSMSTVLYQIYHLSFHDRWHEARDLWQMSHLQTAIDNPNIFIETRIIYNRTLVQLGLCAFRHGNMIQAHHCLVDIQSSNRAKELLAQGLLPNRNQERNAEDEALQRKRMVPFHMHINLELLECAYLVSAMLNEIPYLAQNEFNGRRRMISKQFHHILRMAERNSINAPPDNIREHLVAASKAMKLGDWKKCVSFTINDKLNKQIWNRFPNPDAVKAMLIEKIKEESLRTYLFTYSQFYSNLSIDWLADNFELEKKKIQSIITKLILSDNSNKEDTRFYDRDVKGLSASWDGPTDTLVLHGTEPTRLQNIALQMSSKLAAIVDINEKIAMEQGRSSYQFRGLQNTDSKNNNNYKSKQSRNQQPNKAY